MYYFIINPVSGSGNGQKIWDIVKAELDQRQVAYESYLLSGPGEASNIAAALSMSSQERTIVVLGGDGTIDEVVNGIISFENLTFACIPTGSGNDFARSLNLERDPKKALSIILDPKKKLPVNLGKLSISTAAEPDAQIPEAARGRRVMSAINPMEINSSIQHTFAVSSGIGFDAAVCEEIRKSKLINRLNAIHLGKLIYLMTALRQLFSMKCLTLTVQADDQAPQTFEKTYFAAAMNLPYEGGGFKFCPNACPSDDKLDLIVASGVSKLTVLRMIPLALFGKHVGHEGVTIIRCNKAQLTTSLPACIHSNGEIIGHYDNLSFEVHSASLPVILG